MSNTADQLFDFNAASILVVGNTCLDTYWHGDTNRISPEAPVPVAKYNNSEYRLSGAGLITCIMANVSNNNNNQFKVLSPIGNNLNHRETNNQLIELLRKYNIDTCSNSLIDIASNTPSQIRIVARAQQLLNIDNTSTNIDDLNYLDQVVSTNLVNYKTVIFYDDGSNTINNHFLKKWIAICQEHNITSIYLAELNKINPEHRIDFSQDYLFDYIVYNQIKDDGKFDLNTPSSNILLLDNKDKRLKFFASNNQDNFFVDESVLQVENTIGTSEVLVALFALAISSGKTHKQAIELANSALSLVVRHFGQQVINRIDLQLAYSDYYLNYQYNLLKLNQEIKSCRERGETIVFANGCFDVLHVGHIAYLEAAKQKGDKLFVAINSDCSIKRLKGEQRPINNLEDRMYLLSQLACVDWVVPFFTDTPNEFLSWLKPDILVKGGDYSIDGVVGKEIVEAYGGKVEVIKHSYTQRSSTKIIESTAINSD